MNNSKTDYDKIKDALCNQNNRLSSEVRELLDRASIDKETRQIILNLMQITANNCNLIQALESRVRPRKE